MKVKLLQPIDGFEDVAEYRRAKHKEWYVALTGKPMQASEDHEDGFVPVLTPIKRWRPATIDDACRAIRGESVGARFRDYESDTWEVCEICGYDKKDALPWRSRSQCFIQCEVLDA